MPIIEEELVAKAKQKEQNIENEQALLEGKINKPEDTSSKDISSYKSPYDSLADSLFKNEQEASNAKEKAQLSKEQSDALIMLQGEHLKQDAINAYNEAEEKRFSKQLFNSLNPYQSTNRHPGEEFSKNLQESFNNEADLEFKLNNTIPLATKQALEKSNLKFLQDIDTVNLNKKLADSNVREAFYRTINNYKDAQDIAYSYTKNIMSVANDSYLQTYAQSYNRAAQDWYGATIMTKDYDLSHPIDSLGVAVNNLAQVIPFLAGGLDNLGNLIGANSDIERWTRSLLGLSQMKRNLSADLDEYSLFEQYINPSYLIGTTLETILPSFLIGGSALIGAKGIVGGTKGLLAPGKLLQETKLASLSKIEKAKAALQATLVTNPNDTKALAALTELNKLENAVKTTSLGSKVNLQNIISTLGMRDQKIQSLKNLGVEEVLSATNGSKLASALKGFGVGGAVGVPLMGIGILSKMGDIVGQRGDDNIYLSDFFSAAASYAIDAVGGIAGTIAPLKGTSLLREFLRPNPDASKLKNALTRIADASVEGLAVEGIGEALQTYFEQQGVHRWTLPSIDKILLSDNTLWGKEKREIQTSAILGTLGGFGMAGGISAVSGIVNTASDAYQSLSDKQSRENMSSEQRTTQTEIDNKYTDRYKDNALLAEPVKKIKDLRDKLSNKEVELTNEKGEKVKTKLTPKVSNEQSKAKLEREINLENKKLQKATNELQKEKAKATPNQETIENLEKQIQKSEQAKKDLIETLNEFDRLDNITQSIRSADILDSLFKQESNNLLAEGTTIDSFNQSVSKLANAETEQEYNEAMNEILSKINLPEESKKQLAKDLKQKSISKQANKPTKEAQESKKEQNEGKDTNNDTNDDIELKNDTNDDTTIKGNVVAEESNNQDIDNNQTEEEVEQTEQTENIKNISSERAKEYLQSLDDGKLIMHYLAQALNNASKNSSVKELESLYHLTTVDSSVISNRGLNENTNLNYKDKSDNFLKNNSINLYMIKRDSYFYDEEGNEIHIFLDKDSKLSKSINNVTDKIKQSLNHTFKDKIKVIEQRLSKIQNKPTKQDYIDVINEIKELKNIVNKTFDEMNNDINLIKLLIASNPNTELSKDLNKFLKSVRLEIEKLDAESKQIAQYAKNIGILNETQDSKSEVQQPFSKIATRMTQTFSRIEKLAEQAQVKYNDYLTNADENAKTESFSIVSKLQELFKHIGTFFPKIANIFSITKNAKIQAVYTNILEAEAMSAQTTNFYIANGITYSSSRLPLTLDFFHSMLYDYFKFNDDKVTLDLLLNSFVSSILKEKYTNKTFGAISEQFQRIKIRVNNDATNPNSYNTISLYDILNLTENTLTKIFTKDEISKMIDKYNKISEKPLPAYKQQDDYFDNYLIRSDKLRDIAREELRNKLLNSNNSLKKDIISSLKTNQEFIDYISNITKAGLIVKAQQMISRTKDEYSKDESFESISLLEAQEKHTFFKLIGLENTDVNLDEHFFLANFFANTFLSNLEYQGNKVFDIKLSPKNAKEKAKNNKAKVTNSIALNRMFVEELKIRYGNQLSNFFKELNNDSFAYISNDLKSDFIHNNIPKGRLKAVKALEAVKHKVEQTKLVKYFNDLLGISQEQLDSITNTIATQEPLSSSEFEQKKRIFNNDGKNNNATMERLKNEISKSNPYMYLPVMSYKQSKFTDKWTRDIKYYYMPELMSNDNFTSKFGKDIDNIFASTARASYSQFESRLQNFSELLYIYGNQQLNKTKDAKYNKFKGNIDFNRTFRLKYSVQPATRIYTKDIVANSITNKLLRDVIDFSVDGDVNHKHKTLNEFTKDKDIYDGAFYGFLNIFAKDVDKLTLTNNKEAIQKKKDIYDKFSNGKLVEIEAVEQLAELVDKHLNYIIVDKNGNEVNLKDLYNGVLARNQEAINKFEELVNDNKAENTNIFDEHPFMAINNREIFRKYIKSGNIQDLDTSKIKVYVDGASTAIFENMIRFEGIELMNHLARTYTAEMNYHNQALTRLNKLSDKIQSDVLDTYIDLLDKLGYYSKDMYDNVVAKKGLDPYVLGMALFQNQMSKFAYTNSNLFASLIAQGNMFDRDNMKKLILPYLYGSTIDAVMIKALSISIPQHNKALYSLLEEFRNEFNNLNVDNTVNTTNDVQVSFIQFLRSKLVSHKELRDKDNKLKFSEVRKTLNLLNTYSPKAKQLLNHILDLIEKENPNINIALTKDDSSVAGYYNKKKNTITLNLSHNNPNNFIETIIHEMLHSINPKDNLYGEVVKIQEEILKILPIITSKDNETVFKLTIDDSTLIKAIENINSFKELEKYRNQFKDEKGNIIEGLDNVINSIVTSKDTNNNVYSDLANLVNIIINDNSISEKAKKSVNYLYKYSYMKNTGEFISRLLTEPDIINSIVDDKETYDNINKILNKLVTPKNQNNITNQKIPSITTEERIANIYYNWLNSDIKNNPKELFDEVFSFNSNNKLVINYSSLDNNIGNFENQIVNDGLSNKKIPDGIFKEPLDNLINYMKYFEITNRYTEQKFDKNYLSYCNKLIELFNKPIYTKKDLIEAKEFGTEYEYSPLYSFFKSLTRNMIANDIELQDGILTVKQDSKLDKLISDYNTVYSSNNITRNDFIEVALNVYKAYDYTYEFLPEHNPSMNQIVTPDLIITRESSDRAFRMKNQLQKAIYINSLRITEQVVKDIFSKYRPNIKLNAKNLELATKDAKFNKILTDEIHKAKKEYFESLLHTTVSEQNQQIQSTLETSKLSANKKSKYKQDIAEATQEYYNETQYSLLKRLDDQKQGSLDIHTIVMRQKGDFAQVINALNEDIFVLPDVLGLFNHNLEAAVVSHISSKYKLGLQIYDGMVSSATDISKIIRTWNYLFGVYHDAVIDIPSLLTKVMEKSNEIASSYEEEYDTAFNDKEQFIFLESAATYMIELSRKTRAESINIATKEAILNSNKNKDTIGKKYSFIEENLANIIEEARKVATRIYDNKAWFNIKESNDITKGNKWTNRVTYNTLGNKNLNFIELLIEVKGMDKLEAARYLISKYQDNFTKQVDSAFKNSVSKSYNVTINDNLDIETENKVNRINKTYENIQKFKLFYNNNLILLDNVYDRLYRLPLVNRQEKTFGELMDNTFNNMIIAKLIDKTKALNVDEQSKKDIINKINKLDKQKLNINANVEISPIEKLFLTELEAKEIFDNYISEINNYAKDINIFETKQLVKFKGNVTSLIQKSIALNGNNGYHFIGKQDGIITPFSSRMYNTHFLDSVNSENDGNFHTLITTHFTNKLPKDSNSINNSNIKQDLTKMIDMQNLLNTYGNEVSIKGNAQGKFNAKEAERIINEAEEISLNNFVALMKENLNNELANSNLSIEEKNAIEQTYNALIDIVENTGNLKVYQSKEINSQRGISVANRANRETAIILFDNQYNETPFHEYIHSLLEYAFNETSNEVSAIKNKLYSIKEQVKQELDNNPNLRQELGLSDKDYEYIFNNPEGQDRILHEFLATFLSRPKLAAYLANKSYSPISNRLANIKGNNKIGTALNGLKALIGILYDLFTLSAFKDRTSMLHLTNRLVRDISQYNTLEGVKAKQLAYENSNLNKANKAVKSFANAVTFKIFMGVDSFTKSKGYTEQDINELKSEIYQTTQAMKDELAKYLDAMDNTTSTSKKVLLASIAVLKSLWMSRHIANNPIKRNMVINVLNDFRQRLVEGTFLDFQINMDLGVIVDKGLAKMKNGVDRILSANTSFAIEEENSAVMIRDEVKNIIYNNKFVELRKWIDENKAKDKDFERKYEESLTRLIYGLKLSDYFYGVEGNISSSELNSLISRTLNKGDNITKANKDEINSHVDYIMQVLNNNNQLTKEMNDKFRIFLLEMTRDLAYTRMTRKHNMIGLQNSEEIFNILNNIYQVQTNKNLSLGKDKLEDNSNYNNIVRKLHQSVTLNAINLSHNFNLMPDIAYFNQSASLVIDVFNSTDNKELQSNIATVISLLTQIHRNSEERNNKKRILNEELAKEYYLQGKNISDRIFLDTQYKTITLNKVANYKEKLQNYIDKGYEIVSETSKDIKIRIPSVYKEVSSFDRDTRRPFYMEGYLPFTRNNPNLSIVKLDKELPSYEQDMKYYLDKGYTIIELPRNSGNETITYLKYNGFANYNNSSFRLGFVFEDRIAAGNPHKLYQHFSIEEQDDAYIESIDRYKEMYQDMPTKEDKFSSERFYTSQFKSLAGSETISRDNVSLEALESLTEPDIRISNMFYSQEHNIFKNNTKDFINNQIFYQIILANDTIKKRAGGKYSKHHHAIPLFHIQWEKRMNRDTRQLYNAPRIIPNEQLFEDYGIKFSRDDLANFYRILKATNYDFNKKGNEAIYVDTRMLPMMFGFEKLTFNDVTKNGKLQKAINYTTTTLRGLVKETRNNTIIRNPSLVWENFKSNVVGLIGEGIPLADIFNNIPVIIQQLKEYQELHKEQKSLETKLSALARTRKQDTKIVNDLNERLSNVKRNLKNHPLNYVMENGFYTNIVEDAETEGFKWDNKILDKLQENTNISDETKSYLKDLAMTEDSNTYKLLADFTRLGDFVPRVIYYNHLIGLQGINKSKALDMARDKFVNYNTPLWSKALRNLDYFGLVNYAKYNFNIQKQILQAFTNSPIQASSIVGLNVAAKSMGISPAFMPSNYLVESWLIDGNMPKGLMTGNISTFVNNLNRWNYVTP